MDAPRQPDQAERAPSAAHPEALLKVYGEVAGNFRLLTDIRFKLLAFLPIAAGAATALLSARGGGGGAAEVRALALSVFGVVVTAALATYNARNDELYDSLTCRAASIERQLGVPAGAFAGGPAPSAISMPVVRRRWPIDHRTPVALVYGCSVALWTFSACAAAVELAWGDDPAPRGVLAAALVPAIVLPATAARSIRRRRRGEMARGSAAKGSDRGVAGVAQDEPPGRENASAT